MDLIRIWGETRLQGKVVIQGSKNGVLPILAGSVLTGEVFLRGCPKISDVYGMIAILEEIGCKVRFEEKGLRVNAQNLCTKELPAEAIGGMRASLCFLGALLGAGCEVKMKYPGGCVIGRRPIDLHILALQQLGVEFEETTERIHARCKKLTGAEIRLPFPSVGVTENVILAAVKAKGLTVLRNAAMEPEVQTLCEFLNKCGAHIEGAGTGELKIEGCSSLGNCDFCIPADRIVAGTYLFAVIATGGNVLLEKAPVEHMKEVIRVAEKMGAVCTPSKEGLYVQAERNNQKLSILETAVYPGFPTDLQSVALACSCIGEGRICIVERLFENRFHIVSQLRRMGADIRMRDPHCAEICRVSGLLGCELEAKELRGGAALVVAGLAAKGESLVRGCSYIERGYENICKDLQELGARVVSV